MCIENNTKLFFHELRHLQNIFNPFALNYLRDLSEI